MEASNGSLVTMRGERETIPWRRPARSDGDESPGPKRTLSILRKPRMGSFFWTGKAGTLHELAFTRITGYTLEDLPDISTWFECAYPNRPTGRRCMNSGRNSSAAGATPWLLPLSGKTAGCATSRPAEHSSMTTLSSSPGRHRADPDRGEPPADRVRTERGDRFFPGSLPQAER